MLLEIAALTAAMLCRQDERCQTLPSKLVPGTQTDRQTGRQTDRDRGSAGTVPLLLLPTRKVNSSIEVCAGSQCFGEEPLLLFGILWTQ